MTETAPAPIRHANDGVTFLLLKQLRPSKTNPRRMVDKKADAELVASIKEHGIVQPLLVRELAAEQDEKRPSGWSQSYEVVAGARRFRCAKEAALLEVPCFVREMTDAQALELQIVENAHRKDVNPLDEGAAFRTMIDQHGYTAEAIAQKLNRSPRWVYGRMQLAKLPVDVQTLYVEQRIDLSIAQLLTTVPEKHQSKAAKEIMAGGYGNGGHPMSFRQAKDHVDRTYRCTLADAPFDTGRKDLVPDMGACKACPHASNNQAGLFDQVLPEKGKAPALCTLPSCYQQKTLAAFEERAAEVEAAGGSVLRGADAKKVPGMDLDERLPAWKDPKGRTYRQLLGKHLPKDAIVLVEPLKRSGARVATPEERIAPKVLREALKKAGHGHLAPPAKTAATSSGATSSGGMDRWKREQEAARRLGEQRQRAFGTALPQLLEASRQLATHVALALIIRHGLADQLGALSDGELKEIANRFGFDPERDGEQLLEQSGQLLLELALEIVVRDAGLDVFGKQWPHDDLDAIARACNVDLKKALADVVAADKAAAKAAAKAERDAAKVKKQKPAAPAKGKAKAKKSKR